MAPAARGGDEGPELGDEHEGDVAEHHDADRVRRFVRVAGRVPQSVFSEEEAAVKVKTRWTRGR